MAMGSSRLSSPAQGVRSHSQPCGRTGHDTGLQDAANLSWKIAEALKGHGSSALLDSYHDECRPSGQRILKYTDRLFLVMVSQSVYGELAKSSACLPTWACR
jgi:2-polyprenyl-6-methoxyphenol hydroxylase-like FAD-dependent oxidoreductase